VECGYWPHSTLLGEYHGHHGNPHFKGNVVSKGDKGVMRTDCLKENEDSIVGAVGTPNGNILQYDRAPKVIGSWNNQTDK
jgi:hypothetical protein